MFDFLNEMPNPNEKVEDISGDKPKNSTEKDEEKHQTAALNSLKLSPDRMRMMRELSSYFPTEDVFKSNYSIETLKTINKNVSDFLCTKEITEKNISDGFGVLLQIEDLKKMETYTRFTQKHLKIHYSEKHFTYCVKLRNLPKGLSVVDFLSPFVELVIMPGYFINNDWHSEKNPVKYLYEWPNKFRKRIFHGTISLVDRAVVYFSVKELNPKQYSYANLKSRQEFRKMIKKKCNLIFRPSRISLMFQHNALQLLRSPINLHLQSYLFPTVVTQRTARQFPINIFNKNIENSSEQLQAVTNVVNAALNVPYIIFGPPGTGKTSVITECILQLLKCNSNSKILVTAGSNAACDEIAKRLCVALNLPAKENILLRIYAKSIEKNLLNISSIVMRNSNLSSETQFYPCFTTVNEFRIIVCTQTVCGILLQDDLIARGLHFSHVFIDECASSTEPEALVAIVEFVTKNTQLIISGDPKQLGPIIETNIAKEFGLSISLMERLLNRSCYSVDCNGSYDRSIQTRLVKNYRSHRSILQFSNHLYYNDKLEPCASEDITNWCVNWPKLPIKNIPIIFNAVTGNFQKDEDSTSLYNMAEIKEVLNYVRDMMSRGINGRKINQDDIGIISPYKKQCTYIQYELKTRKWNQIEVGSTENFQGREKSIIIISTVRSNTSNVGFLDNPKRLNVLLTRAKALMIIVGNPDTLKNSPDWKYVVDYCVENHWMVRKVPTKSNISNITVQLNQLSIHNWRFQKSRTNKFKT